MNWTTEIPKESGWYWVNSSMHAEVAYLAPDLKTVWVVADSDPRKASVFCWGDKLEIPE